MQTEIALHWFRRDLRFEDNSALYYALRSNKPVLPIFIFDKIILDQLDDRVDARVQFIHYTLSGLQNKLIKLGSSLSVHYGESLEVFKKLQRQFEIKEVYTNRDYEPYAYERDAEIKKFLKNNSISFLTFKDHVFFEKDEIITDTDQYYKVFTPYKNKWMDKLKSLQLELFPSENLMDNFLKIEAIPMPSLQEMNFQPSDILIPPLEFDTSVIKKYDEKRNFPAIKGTSRLGIHLRFGTVSIRKCVAEASKLNQTWLNELIWRDFYSMVLDANPHVVGSAFKSKYDLIPWRIAPEEFDRWCKGQTGYPIVDAGMRELNHTGYMHNRVRMIVASFLTKHLLIDWRLGEAYFAKKLLDFDLASNNGGWQWAAGTGTDAQPYFRVFNPQSQTEKFDKDLKYIHKWVPEFDTENYPKPMVDHKFARERAIEVYKKALNN